MFSFFELTDGVTADATELTNMGQYALVSYAPVVTPLTDNLLGIHGPWAGVQEQVTFHALGCTAAEAYQNAAAVNKLLDNARRWYDRSSITPIVLRVMAQDTAIATPLQAPIFGRPIGGPPNMALPVQWSEYYGKYMIQSITLAFQRGGPFLSAASESAAGVATANPSIMTVTMPSTMTIPGPCVTSLAGFALTAGRAVDIPNGIFAIAPSTGTLDNGMALLEGESPTNTTLAAGAAFASTADAAARASAGNVGRLNHSGTTVGLESRLYYILSAWGSARRMAVYCTVRNNSASVWTIRAENVLNDLALTSPGTPTITVAAGPSNPTVTFLGELDMAAGSQGVNIFATATVNSGACTLDIDTVLMVDLTAGQTTIAQINGIRTTLITATPSSAVQLEVRTRPLSEPDPVIVWTNVGNLWPTSYSGSPATWIAGSVIRLCWYATHLVGGVTPYWTTQNAAGAAILSLTPTITRQTAYLLPE